MIPRIRYTVQISQSQGIGNHGGVFKLNVGLRWQTIARFSDVGKHCVFAPGDESCREHLATLVADRTCDHVSGGEKKQKQLMDQTPCIELCW